MFADLRDKTCQDTKCVYAKENEQDLHPCCHDHPPTGRRPRARALGGLLTSEDHFSSFSLHQPHLGADSCLDR